MSNPKRDGTMLWGGRFKSGLDPLMEKFNESINIDKRMWEADIEGSIAYAAGLTKAGLLSENERQGIVKGFQIIREEWENSKFIIKNGDEDIHTANERRLKEICGAEIGGKLHTGRSRNDQVATDMKIWLRNEADALIVKMNILLKSFCDRAESNIEVLMPGYTHLQRAQPVRWSHWLMSHAWSFLADRARLEELVTRANLSPLGSGAIAGNPFNINRNEIATDLGFSGCSENSMQSVADRDFIAEFLFWAALAGTHFSKLAEDLIIYSTKEFGFVSLSEAYSTGSSLMPQKRNPDSLELMRGNSGLLIGQHVGFLSVLKGLPSTYNKDLQNDKKLMFDAADNISALIEIATGLLTTLKVDSKRCYGALSTDMLATDVAYYLVRKGMPFRDAHEIAGKVVCCAEQKHCSLHQLHLSDLKQISDLFDEDVKNVWNFENSVEQYSALGGTSSSSVLYQIQRLRSKIK